MSAFCGLLVGSIVMAGDPLATSPSWSAEGGPSSQWFGISVASAGDVNGDGYADVIIGDYGYDNDETNEGRAVAYYGSADGLSATADWVVEGDQEWAYFGFSVSSAGDVNGDGYDDVIVGSIFFDNGEEAEGRVYVYYGSDSGLSPTVDWVAEGNQEGARFGESVASAGDVNGDGFADVIVGAFGYSNGEQYEGGVFVYHGSPTGLDPYGSRSSGSPDNADWMAEGNLYNARFHEVACAGDVNADGYDDVIVGAMWYGSPQWNEGGAFVYYGSPTGLDLNGSRPSGNPQNADWTAESDQTNAQLGFSVASAGDVNGDGYSDVIVGAGNYDEGQSNEGAAFVYHGSLTGLDFNPGTSANTDWMAQGDQASAYFGTVASIGDANGDGYSDVLVGARMYDNGEADEGRALLYAGSASGLSTEPVWMAESDHVEARFGTVASAGDVNGDGYSDALVGAHTYDQGRVFLYHGSPEDEDEDEDEGADDLVMGSRW